MPTVQPRPSGVHPRITTESVNYGDGWSLSVTRCIGARPGPRIGLLAGVHGDEEEGVLTLRRLILELERRPLRGEITLIPIANPAAYVARNRENPVDGKNLARVFPGRLDGTSTERLAHQLTEQAIRGADLLIDLHSGGLLYDMPFFAGYRADGSSASRKSALAAEAFGAPMVWAHRTQSPGRSLSAAQALGVPAIYVEGPGGGEIRKLDADGYLEGVLNVLAIFECIEVRPKPATAVQHLGDLGGDIDAAISAQADGLMVRHVSAGQRVKRGEVLAEIFSFDGHCASRVLASEDGLVMLIRRGARVKAGDTVAMVAGAT